MVLEIGIAKVTYAHAFAVSRGVHELVLSDEDATCERPRL